MIYNSTKQIDYVIITALNILQEINYQNLHQLSFPHRLQYISYHLNTASSTSIIVVRKNFFAAILCIYVLASSILSFLYNAIVYKPVLFHF